MSLASKSSVLPVVNDFGYKKRRIAHSMAAHINHEVKAKEVARLAEAFKEIAAQSKTPKRNKRSIRDRILNRKSKSNSTKKTKKSPSAVKKRQGNKTNTPKNQAPVKILETLSESEDGDDEASFDQDENKPLDLSLNPENNADT